MPTPSWTPYSIIGWPTIQTQSYYTQMEVVTAFDNHVVHGLAKLRGWDRATISTTYAKWTHGVAEKMNRDVQDVSAPLCRHLHIEVNQ